MTCLGNYAKEMDNTDEQESNMELWEGLVNARGGDTKSLHTKSFEAAANALTVVSAIAIELHFYEEFVFWAEGIENLKGVLGLGYESDDDEEFWVIDGVEYPKPPRKEEEKYTEEEIAKYTRNYHECQAKLDQACNAFDKVKAIKYPGMVFCKGEKPLIRNSKTEVVTPDSRMSAKTYVGALVCTKNAYDFFPSVEDVELCNDFFRAAGMDCIITHDDRTPERVKEVVCMNDDMGETFDRYNTKKGTRKRHQKVVNEYSSDDVVIVLKGQ